MPTLKLRLEQDGDAQDPRKDFDHIGVMVCFHRRYNLGDEHPYNSDNYSSWDEIQSAIELDHPGCTILPLYLYDHSGITISTSPFRCGWDSGQIGFIYADAAKLKSEGIPDAVKCLEGEVEEYDMFLTGDVWGYIVEDEEGQDIDSCWGFYGEKYAQAEGEMALKCCQAATERKAEQFLQAVCR